MYDSDTDRKLQHGKGRHNAFGAGDMSCPPHYVWARVNCSSIVDETFLLSGKNRHFLVEIPWGKLQLFSSTLAVLAVPSLVNLAGCDTAPQHRRNTTIAVTNDRNPLGAMLVRKSCSPPVRILLRAGGSTKFDGRGCLIILYEGKLL